MNRIGEIGGHIRTGPAIADALDGLATLRLEIFREYPYLYQGCREDELAYLGIYTEAPEACVILACDGSVLTGAVTGMPIVHEDAELLEAFAGTAFPLNQVYYIGELLLRPAYRSCGLGRKLLALMEDHVRSLGRYRTLACATVERSDEHHLRPPDHIPIARFLARTAFVRIPGVTARFSWRETDGVKRDHSMQFWTKKLFD